MKKKKSLALVEPYIWLLPSILLMAVFIMLPIFEVFRTALSEVSRAGLIKGFCGLDNFTKVLKGSTFQMVLKNTVVWTVVVVVLSTVFGFILALVLNNEFRFRKAVRAVVVFPWATSLIIQAGVWKFIIDKDYGALNTLLMKLHIIANPVNWTPTPGAYFAWECFVGIFVTVPFVTFCVLSGLQSIDTAYYEAATVDGCNRVTALIRILLPVAAPGIVTALIFVSINAWNEYTVALTLMSTDVLKPLTVGITIFNGYNMIEWQYLFASSLFATIPVVILFVLIEKHLVGGLTSGGVKG